MTEALPQFRYHPDPVATGAIEASDLTCECCERERCYIYNGAVYGMSDLENICPWCIADGSAAALGLSFVAVDFPNRYGMSAQAVDELAHRTPGYRSWQPNDWCGHCEDACAVMGPASAEDVKQATPDTQSLFMRRYKWDQRDWDELAADFEPGANSTLFKFVCLHCSQVMFSKDLF